MGKDRTIGIRIVVIVIIVGNNCLAFLYLPLNIYIEFLFMFTTSYPFFSVFFAHKLIYVTNNSIFSMLLTYDRLTFWAVLEISIHSLFWEILEKQINIPYLVIKKH